jgi:hypothetical protein
MEEALTQVSQSGSPGSLHDGARDVVHKLSTSTGAIRAGSEHSRSQAAQSPSDNPNASAPAGSSIGNFVAYSPSTSKSSAAPSIVKVQSSSFSARTDHECSLSGLIPKGSSTSQTQTRGEHRSSQGQLPAPQRVAPVIRDGLSALSISQHFQGKQSAEIAL